MTPHIEQRLAQIIEENGYGAEIQHAMRLVVSLMDLEMAELEAEKWHRKIAEGALLSVEKERDELRARLTELERIAAINRARATKYFTGLPAHESKIKAEAVREARQCAVLAHEHGDNDDYMRGFDDAIAQYDAHLIKYADYIETNQIEGGDNG